MGGKIEVRKVGSKKAMKEFILLPWTCGIYDNDPCWIPPVIGDQKKFLDPQRGYFFENGEADLFLAYRGDTPVGRISAHVNRLYEKKYDGDTGFFGFYESVNDVEVAAALFDAAEEWLRARSKKIMNGPQSFSIYDSVGFEVEGTDRMPSVGNLHFAAYYRNLAEACGFRKCIDWYCFLVKELEDYQPYLKEVRESYMKGQGVEYKTLCMKDWKSRSLDLQRIFNAAWEGNWGHLPLTDKQFQIFVKELKPLVIPELCIFAEKDGETVGFVLSLPDANPALRLLNGRLYPWRLVKALREVKRARRLRTIIMGVMPEYQGRKIDDVFYLRTIEEGLRRGFNESDCSLIVETNKKMIAALKPLKAERYKTYRIYERDVGAPHPGAVGR
jgi:GNAT superfamily N-acetyltransferase